MLYYIDTYVQRYSQVSLIGAQSPVKIENGKVILRFSTRELLSDFRILSKMLGMKCPWENERQLGVRLVDSSEVLKKAGWGVEEYFCSGKKKHRYTRKMKGKDND